MNTETPLIWTTKGNLPQADLTYSYGWEETPDATVFWEEYRLGDEIVKRNCHARSKRGLASEAVAASIGG